MDPHVRRLVLLHRRLLDQQRHTADPRLQLLVRRVAVEAPCGRLRDAVEILLSGPGADVLAQHRAVLLQLGAPLQRDGHGRAHQGAEARVRRLPARVLRDVLVEAELPHGGDKREKGVRVGAVQRAVRAVVRPRKPDVQRLGDLVVPGVPVRRKRVEAKVHSRDRVGDVHPGRRLRRLPAATHLAEKGVDALEPLPPEDEGVHVFELLAGQSVKGTLLDMQPHVAAGDVRERVPPPLHGGAQAVAQVRALVAAVHQLADHADPHVLAVLRGHLHRAACVAGVLVLCQDVKRPRLVGPGACRDPSNVRDRNHLLRNQFLVVLEELELCSLRVRNEPPVVPLEHLGGFRLVHLHMDVAPCVAACPRHHLASAPQRAPPMKYRYCSFY
eukprot:Rhum_TRINITY_DN16960_c0_g1::Rhum_TRINITY_DN16960_c0_g1_i1::g.164904::m.164904